MASVQSQPHRQVRRLEVLQEVVFVPLCVLPRASYSINGRLPLVFVAGQQLQQQFRPGATSDLAMPYQHCSFVLRASSEISPIDLAVANLYRTFGVGFASQ